ncbi:L-lactate dehydrogenase [Caldicellulosiruptoraceae bacterium PP1]
MRKPGKIVIIGTGFVGSSTAFAIMDAGLATELVLIDVNKEKAEGEAMDLNHGISFVKPVKIYAGDYSDCKDADIVIITAGANQKPGETRLDLTKKNATITKSIVENIIKYTTDAILLMVTNPVDILTYVVYKVSQLPKNQVIGSGTVLDSSRFRYLLAQHCNVDVRNVHAYILGEHGDSEMAAWSLTNIGGVNFMQECLLCGNNCPPTVKQEIFDKVKNAAYEIIQRKGATYYAIALAVRRIVESIIRNENTILPVSSVVDDVFGISDIAISLPSVVNNTGVVKVFDIPLTDEEIKSLQNSAKVLKETIKSLEI